MILHSEKLSAGGYLASKLVFARERQHADEPALDSSLAVSPDQTESGTLPEPASDEPALDSSLAVYPDQTESGTQPESRSPPEPASD